MSAEQPKNEQPEESNVDQIPKQYKPRWLEMQREGLKREEELLGKLDPDDPYRKEVVEVRVEEMKKNIAKLEKELEENN